MIAQPSSLPGLAPSTASSSTHAGHGTRQWSTTVGTFPDHATTHGKGSGAAGISNEKALAPPQAPVAYTDKVVGDDIARSDANRFILEVEVAIFVDSEMLLITHRGIARAYACSDQCRDSAAALECVEVQLR